MAEQTHWARSQLGTVAVALCRKKPLEGRVWYNYPHQPSVDEVEVSMAGSTTAPSATARLLDGGVTQATFATYNSSGLITQSIDPAGRTTNYSYAANGLDLIQVSLDRVTTGLANTAVAIAISLASPRLAVARAKKESPKTKELGRSIARPRTSTRPTQESLAEKAGISARYIQDP